MKNIYFFRIIFFIALVSLISCSKESSNPGELKNLNDFCEITPSGWECEVITEDFNISNIPSNTESPEVIVKYINRNIKFTKYDNTKENPSLKLNFYPIEKKDALIEFIRSQQLYSWCIPMYYGETDDYLIVTSPCFINGGTFTDEAKASISDLHEALKSIITINDYDLIGQ